MPFDVLERSRWGGKPFHLFIFQRQHLMWRFANLERDEVIGGQTFLSVPIARTALRDSTESPRNNVTITMPYVLDPGADEFPVTQAFGNNWRPFPPSDRIFVSCLAMHRGDDAPAIEWVGRVVSPTFKSGKLELLCEPTRSSGRRTGLQARFQRACWKHPYSQGVGQCNLSEEDNAVAATLTGVDGLTLTADEFGTLPEGVSLAGGSFRWMRDDGLTDFRSIVSHDGTTVRLLYGATDLAEGLEGVALPHCGNNWDGCKRLGNEVNYGGGPYKPVKNPMSGNPVW